MTPSHFLLVLAVSDLPRAKAFYDAAFGWEVEVDLPVFVEYLVRPGVGLALYPREGFAGNVGSLPVQVPAGALAPSEVYLVVPDLDAAIRRLQAAGGRVLSPRSLRPWGAEAAYFADPDGNVVAVATERPE